jgi:predicted O-linked N-acetylglucosamine transferase (SPINDLY family)
MHKLRGDAAQAEADIGRALALEPQHADWRCALGEALALQGKPDAAAASYRAVLEIDPGDARAHNGLGVALLIVGRPEEAESSFRRAIETQPDYAEAHSNMLLAMHYRKGDDARLMYEAHLEWARRHARDLARPEHAGRAPAPARRLNIGYLSPDFQHHAVAWFIEPVLAAHDRSRFRTFFYSTVVNPDAVTRRFMTLCDEWRDIHTISDGEAARLIRQDRIDILVDLAGHTGGGRPLVFARKPAPVQVTWLGYPNTTGLAGIDYRITDADADPEGEADRHHTEKLLRLATGFFCYAPPADAPDSGEPPVLESGRITFGCFNNLAKVTPEMIGLWSRILAGLPQARLIMKTHALGEESARRAIHGHFAANGIAAGRVELFGPEGSHGGHLGRYRQVDIALDAFPYHGTTTTCEALWMGTPVVTLAGRTHLSRVGVSVLRRIGLDELIAATPEEYVRKAVALARDPGRLRKLRAGLRQRMRVSPLLDAAAFARALESAYLAMWSR